MTRRSPDMVDAFCTGKVAFEDKALADRIAHRSSHRHDKKMAAYFCPVCRKYHVGERERGPGRPRNG